MKNPDETKQRKREIWARFRRKNREKIAKYMVSYRASHRDEILAYHAAYREQHREKATLAAIDWAKNNHEKKLSYMADYHAANRERESAYGRARRLNDPEFLARKKASIAAWRLANPEQCRVHIHNRRARKEQNGGTLSSNIVDILMSEQDGKCVYCFADLADVGFHLDHFMPVVLGGKNEDDNIQLTCPTCNCRKHAKHPAEFLKEVFGMRG